MEVHPSAPKHGIDPASTIREHEDPRQAAIRVAHIVSQRRRELAT